MIGWRVINCCKLCSPRAVRCATQGGGILGHYTSCQGVVPGDGIYPTLLLTLIDVLSKVFSACDHQKWGKAIPNGDLVVIVNLLTFVECALLLYCIYTCATRAPADATGIISYIRIFYEM